MTQGVYFISFLKNIIKCICARGPYEARFINQYMLSQEVTMENQEVMTSKEVTVAEDTMNAEWLTVQQTQSERPGWGGDRGDRRQSFSFQISLQ